VTTVSDAVDAPLDTDQPAFGGRQGHLGGRRNRRLPHPDRPAKLVAKACVADVRSQDTRSDVDIRRAISTAIPAPTHLRQTDPLMDSKDWNDDHIAYRNGGSVAGPRIGKAGHRSEEPTQPAGPKARRVVTGCSSQPGANVSTPSKDQGDACRGGSPRPPAIKNRVNQPTVPTIRRRGRSRCSYLCS